MKFLRIATLALSTFFAGHALSVEIYDNVNVPGGGIVVRIAGNHLMGDEINFQLDPFGPDETIVDGYDVYVYVAAAGTYSLTMSIYEDACFTYLAGSTTQFLTFPPDTYPRIYVISSTFPGIVCEGANPRWVQFEANPNALSYVCAHGGTPRYGTTPRGFYVDRASPFGPPLRCNDRLDFAGASYDLKVLLYGSPGIKAATPPQIRATPVDFDVKVIPMI